MLHPKTRGVRRRCSTLARRLAEVTQSFPAPHDGRGYWHLHLPTARSFIDSPRTPRVSDASAFSCYSTLLHGSSLSVHRPLPPPWSLLSPRLSCSTPNSSLSFPRTTLRPSFHRDEPDQRWTALLASRSLVREWRLSLPPGFSERGFHEHIHDQDYEHHGEIWFFGELS
jgi:Protein of unknown function (DUF3916)